MKLNKVATAVTFFLGLVSVSQAFAATDSGHGVINFKGTIIAAPCSISSETANQVVDLGQISSTTLANNGASTPRAFTIKLENCDVSTLKTVTTTFTGTSTTAAANAGIAFSSGTAKGAYVALHEGMSGKDITLGTPTTAQTLVAGDNLLNFSANLKTEASPAAITAGDFAAVANFAMNYL